MPRGTRYGRLKCRHTTHQSRPTSLSVARRRCVSTVRVQNSDLPVTRLKVTVSGYTVDDDLAVGRPRFDCGFRRNN